jgi:hypothetical protein
VLALAMLAAEIQAAIGFSSKTGECCPQGCSAECRCSAASANQACAKPGGKNLGYSACSTVPSVESMAAFEWKAPHPQGLTESLITKKDLSPFSFIRNFQENFSTEPPDPPPRYLADNFSARRIDSTCLFELT